VVDLTWNDPYSEQGTMINSSYYKRKFQDGIIHLKRKSGME